MDVNDIGLVISKSGQIEQLLKNLGATGKGLQELITSMEKEFNLETTKALRFIGSIRNKVAHGEYENISRETLKGYENQAIIIIKQLTLMVEVKAKSVEAHQRKGQGHQHRGIEQMQKSRIFSKVLKVAIAVVIAGAVIYHWVQNS